MGPMYGIRIYISVWWYFFFPSPAKIIFYPLPWHVNIYSYGTVFTFCSLIGLLFTHLVFFFSIFRLSPFFFCIFTFLSSFLSSSPHIGWQRVIGFISVLEAEMGPYHFAITRTGTGSRSCSRFRFRLWFQFRFRISKGLKYGLDALVLKGTRLRVGEQNKQFQVKTNWVSRERWEKQILIKKFSEIIRGTGTGAGTVRRK